jgi:hypothetical protein
LTLHKVWRSAIENSFVRPIWERAAEVPLSEYRDSVARKPKGRAASYHQRSDQCSKLGKSQLAALEDGSLRILIRLYWWPGHGLERSEALHRGLLNAAFVLFLIAAVRQSEKTG